MVSSKTCVGISAFRAVTVRPALRSRSLMCTRASSQKQDLDQPGAATLLAATLITAPLFNTPAALAVGGEFGLLEGRTAALIHPAMMFFLFGASAYAGYLGLQWRRTRELGEEIRSLKAQLPKPDAEGNRPSSSMDSKISELEQVIANQTQFEAVSSLSTPLVED